MKLKLITSSDGSHTLVREDLDETYHSRHGAIQEALHVFVESGLQLKSHSNKEVRILEVGFGTGLNALLSFLYATKNEFKVDYVGLETFPVESDLVEKLNYTQILDLSDDNMAMFERMHTCTWNEWSKITPNFNLKKVQEEVQTFETDQFFDLIYYDAFGPNAQSDMWEAAIFNKLYKLLNKEGVLVTYCAKGQVRRDLKTAGFDVERLPGPPGKREMLRATKL